MEEQKNTSAIEHEITETAKALHELMPATIFERRLRELAKRKFPNAERERAFASMVKQLRKQASELLRNFDFRGVGDLLNKLELHVDRVLMAPELKTDRMENFRKALQVPFHPEAGGFGYHSIEVAGLEEILRSEKCAEVVSADLHGVVAKTADGREVRITRRQMREASLPTSSNPEKWFAQFPSVPSEAGRGMSSELLPKKLV